MATDPNRETAGSSGLHSAPGTEDAEAYAAKAARCRRLAAGVSDRQAADVLTRMARNYEEAAERLTGRD